MKLMTGYSVLYPYRYPSSLIGSFIFDEGKGVALGCSNISHWPEATPLRHILGVSHGFGISGSRLKCSLHVNPGPSRFS